MNTADLHLDTELGTKEIAEIFQLKRAYVTNELTKRSDFPKPVTRISQKTVRWRWGDVLRFKSGR